MARTDEDLLNEVNRSGFPLQIAVKRLIEASDIRSDWSVRYSEHHWQHASTNREGFIDLVLTQRNGLAEIVLECKRVQNTEWIFLSEAGIPDTTITRGLLSLNGPPRAVHGWTDCEAILSSPESEFCVAIGEDPKAPRAMLERWAASVVESCEALAAEDTQYRFVGLNANPVRVYFPAIVTTASLKKCAYKPDDLAIDSGTLADAVMTDLPFVRFRKQMSATPSEVRAPELGVRPFEVARAKESTVFVINVTRLLHFLRYLEVHEL